jgi:hypothetical protein
LSRWDHEKQYGTKSNQILSEPREMSQNIEHKHNNNILGRSGSPTRVVLAVVPPQVFSGVVSPRRFRSIFSDFPKFIGEQFWPVWVNGNDAGRKHGWTSRNWAKDRKRWGQRKPKARKPHIDQYSVLSTTFWIEKSSKSIKKSKKQLLSSSA